VCLFVGNRVVRDLFLARNFQPYFTIHENVNKGSSVCVCVCAVGTETNIEVNKFPTAFDWLFVVQFVIDMPISWKPRTAAVCQWNETVKIGNQLLDAITLLLLLLSHP